jgi:hypothetical protein
VVVGLILSGILVADISSFLITGFEGTAHPYKQNILRLDGEKSSILDLPEVKTTMEKVAPSPAAASS